MPKVLISDSLSEEAVRIFRQNGIDIDFEPDLGKYPERLARVIGNYDGLAVRSATKVTADLIARAGNLKVIGRAGIGVDNIDLAAASARGIVVMNTPFGNSITTAEHAIALLVALARHIPQATASMKAGKWEKKKFTGMEIYNRTLGLLGMGNIGRLVALRGIGLGMKVIAFDPHISQASATKLGVQLVSFEELLSRADAISVHVPRTKETPGLLGAKAFAKAKPGVLVVNAARGGIVDEAALLAALDSGQVGGAALDVFEEEPYTGPLTSFSNVLLTCHMGSYAKQVRAAMETESIENAVNHLHL